MRVSDLKADFEGFHNHLLIYAEYAGQEGDYDFYEVLTSEANLISNIVTYLNDAHDTEIHLPIAIRQIQTRFPLFKLDSYILYLKTIKEEKESEIRALETKLVNLSGYIQVLEEG